MADVIADVIVGVVLCDGQWLASAWDEGDENDYGQFELVQTGDIVMAQRFRNGATFLGNIPLSRKVNEEILAAISTPPPPVKSISPL